MNTKQTIAIVVVVVVILAAIVAVVATTNDSGNNDTPPASASVASGALFGNVNGDSHIDETDVSIIEGIINGEYIFDDYPLADANGDGAVDESDLDVVRAVINGEDTTLRVVNVDGDAISVQYPATDYAFTSGTNMKSVIAALGLTKSMKGIAIDSDTVSPVLDQELYNGLNDGSIELLVDSQSLTVESLSTLANLGVTLVVGEDSGMSSGSDIVTAMNGMGITYLQLNVKDMDLQINALNTLGILMGCEEEAEAYTAWVEGISDTIIENVGDLYGTATVLSVVMTNSVSGTSSDYYAMTEAAGGKNIADWSGSTQKFNEGDTWLLDSKYNADFIFHFRTVTYPDGLTESQIANYAGYFDNTYTYQNGGYYLINGSLPLPVRLAVMAETMYSDCFDEGWAESVFQEYVTDFLGSDYDVSQSMYIWNA